MRSLLKSIFETNNATDVAPIVLAKEEDFFDDKHNQSGKRHSGIEVVELSFDEYVRMMKSQDKTILS
ncbi:MAG: hypothetical protein ACXW1P_03480 [Methylophilaceae bacterium]